ELTTNAEKEERYTKENLDKAIKKLNGFLKDDNAYAEYNVHEKFGDIMIKIVDRDTKEVLVEVPPKKILDMIAKLCEISGVVFDKKA
uniref:flagellar protein FlaG n=2 Tax=Clostridiaceae TaxID=31979 RepID=UPI0034A11B47